MMNKWHALELVLPMSVKEWKEMMVFPSRLREVSHN